MDDCGAMSCEDEPDTLLDDGTLVIATEVETGAAEAGRIGTDRGAGEAALDRDGLKNPNPTPPPAAVVELALRGAGVLDRLVGAERATISLGASFSLIRSDKTYAV